MLARGKIALLDSALLRKTSSALQKELRAFTTAKAAYWSGITCQFLSPDSEDDRFTERLPFIPIPG
jgi:hypothetical protein